VAALFVFSSIFPVEDTYPAPSQAEGALSVNAIALYFYV
jgi:hypothetical protein